MESELPPADCFVSNLILSPGTGLAVRNYPPARLRAARILTCLATFERIDAISFERNPWHAPHLAGVLRNFDCAT